MKPGLRSPQRTPVGPNKKKKRTGKVDGLSENSQVNIIAQITGKQKFFLLFGPLRMAWANANILLNLCWDRMRVIS